MHHQLRAADWGRKTRAFAVAVALLWAAPAMAQSLTMFHNQDSTVFAPAQSMQLNAYVSSGWTIDSMTITVDGTAHTATIDQPNSRGYITWDCSQATNPSEHYASATAQVHFPYDPGQEVALDSTNPIPPAPAPNGDGRNTDFVIANLQFKSLQFNSPITLRQDANTTVPTPQLTWDQTGHLTNSYAAAFVRNVTPTFTIGIYPYTGNATMGFSMNISESPNTGDAALTLYNATANAPTTFTPNTAITAQAALYNKVALYTSSITGLNLFVKFTLPNTWGYAQGLQGNTYQSTIYAVLATPTAPMAQPWTALLDNACVWAKGDTDATSATTDLTKNSYNSSKYDPSRTWDTDSTTNPETFYLSDFLYGSTSPTWPATSAWNGQCNGFSDFLVCISNALGAHPLKSQQVTGPFNCNPVSYAPNQGAPLLTPQFGYHQFTEDTTIFDSPMRWGGTTQPTDEAGPAAGSAYYNGTVNPAGTCTGGCFWVPQTPFTPTIANHRP